jgi:hypothetical protein
MQITEPSFIDEYIRDLQELRRMSLDPHLLDVMRRLSSSTAPSVVIPPGAALPSPARIAPVVKSEPVRNGRAVGLTQGIADAVSQIDAVFDIHTIFKKLGENGVRIGAAKPYIAISGVLQRLVERGMIVCVEKGRAGEPSRYRRAAQGDQPDLPLNQ